MGLKDIVADLQDTFDTKKGKKKKKMAAIELLLVSLAEKKARFKVKRDAAEDDFERKKYKRKIKVCNAQIVKGEAALDALRSKKK